MGGGKCIQPTPESGDCSCFLLLLNLIEPQCSHQSKGMGRGLGLKHSDSRSILQGPSELYVHSNQ